jgi:GlpG protein
MLPLPQIDFRRTPVTLILAAVIVALEAVCTLDAARRAYYYNDLRLGLLSLIWTGELWRPFTTTLLHGNLLHAAFNVYWLVIFGSALENRFGSGRTLGLIVLLAYVSMMPQFIVTNYHTNVSRQIGVVGFSGVNYGLFGILLVGRRKHIDLEAVCNASTVQLFIVWFFFCIGLTWLDMMPVANVAHGAGLIFGVLYGLVIFDRKRRWRWAGPAAVATLAVLATLVYCPGHNGYEHARRIRQIRRSLRLLDQHGHLRIRVKPEEPTPADDPEVPVPPRVAPRADDALKRSQHNGSGKTG